METALAKTSPTLSRRERQAGTEASPQTAPTERRGCALFPR